MTVTDLMERLAALPGYLPVLVPGLNAGFDETAGPELRSLVAVASDSSQTSMGTWMEAPADGAYPSHRRCQAVVLGRLARKD